MVKSKTARLPHSQQPRHRLIRMQLEGFRQWPGTIGPHEPRHAWANIELLQGESDRATRRAAHRELDRMLDRLLPNLPPLGPEYATWAQGIGEPYVPWHLVEARPPKKLRTACGALPPSSHHAIFNHEPINWGLCSACTAVTEAKEGVHERLQGERLQETT